MWRSFVISLRDEGKIFATQRGYGEFKGGWEFPGGKIEPNETPEAAIVREIKEELDTEVQVIELLDTVEYDYPKFHLSMDCFVMVISKNGQQIKVIFEPEQVILDGIRMLAPRKVIL